MSRRSRSDEHEVPPGTGVFGDGSDDTGVLVSVTGAVLAVAVGWVARRALDTAWRRARGHRPPRPGDDGAVTEVVVAAALTAALAALAQVLGRRGARRWLKGPSLR